MISLQRFAYYFADSDARFWAFAISSLLNYKHNTHKQHIALKTIWILDHMWIENNLNPWSHVNKHVRCRMLHFYRCGNSKSKTSKNNVKSRLETLESANCTLFLKKCTFVRMCASYIFWAWLGVEMRKMQKLKTKMTKISAQFCMYMCDLSFLTSTTLSNNFVLWNTVELVFRHLQTRMWPVW